MAMASNYDQAVRQLSIVIGAQQEKTPRMMLAGIIGMPDAEFAEWEADITSPSGLIKRRVFFTEPQMEVWAVPVIDGSNTAVLMAEVMGMMKG